MKKRFRLLYAVLSVAALGFTACDEVDEGQRYLLMPDVEAKRAVLLEEFTGQMCTNCPDAQRRISRIKEQYGENLVVVGIHAGHFGVSEAEVGPLGLMQPEGNEYANYWDVESYPAGVINRSSGVLNAPEWAAYVRNEMTKTTSLDIHLTAVVAENEAGGNVISIRAELEPMTSIRGKLQLWITENQIRSFQVDGDSTIMDYEHNHVYRASVNGTWGEDVALEDYQIVERTIPVRDNWNTANLSVVGFVYNDAEGVLQVAECKVDSVSH